MNRLRDNVERWLTHENYSFKEVKDTKEAFCIRIKHLGTFGYSVDIFEPAGQQGILVIGSKVPLKNNQNVRYLRLNEEERARFEKKVGDFCYSIKAIHKMLEEDGKKVVGVYVVLDKEEHLNQQHFFEVLDQISEMTEKTTQFLLKAF